MFKGDGARYLDIDSIYPMLPALCALCIHGA